MYDFSLILKNYIVSSLLFNSCMTIKDFISKFEERFSLYQAEDFDNVGLLCGNLDREITGILICHDALENIIDEAIEKKYNFILCFHPIIFSGLKSITGKNYVEKAVLKAIENKIAIYAIHTVLDNDYFGVNHRICKELGLENLQILIPKKQNLSQLSVYVPKDYAENVQNALFEAKAGNIGFYDECSFSINGAGSFRPLENSNPFIGKNGERSYVEETMISVIFENYKKNQILSALKSAHPYEEIAYQIYSLENENHYAGLGMIGNLPQEMEEIEFLNFLKEKFSLKIIRHSTLINKKIKKVAVLGGSGASGIKNAMQNNCDAYITGDLKYHDFFTAEKRLLLCDIGHFESEQFVVQQLYEFLSENFTTFAVSKSSINTNPINYFL